MGFEALPQPRSRIVDSELLGHRTLLAATTYKHGTNADAVLTKTPFTQTLNLERFQP